MGWGSASGSEQIACLMSENTRKQPPGLVESGKICREPTPDTAGRWALAYGCGGVWITAQRLGGVVLVVDV